MELSADEERHLECPLTLEPFVEPVTTRHGITFERAAIEAYAASKAAAGLPVLCPVTGLPLGNPPEVFPNLVARALADGRRRGHHSHGLRPDHPAVAGSKLIARPVAARAERWQRWLRAMSEATVAVAATVAVGVAVGAALSKWSPAPQEVFAEVVATDGGSAGDTSFASAVGGQAVRAGGAGNRAWVPPLWLQGE
jgi:hypothetical protein